MFKYCIYTFIFVSIHNFGVVQSDNVHGIHLFNWDIQLSVIINNYYEYIILGSTHNTSIPIHRICCIIIFIEHLYLLVTYNIYMSVLIKINVIFNLSP